MYSFIDQGKHFQEEELEGIEEMILILKKSRFWIEELETVAAEYNLSRTVLEMHILWKMGERAIKKERIVRLLADLHPCFLVPELAEFP